MTRTKSLRAKYNEEVKAALKEKFGYKNDMMIPKLHKIVLNMGVGESSHNSKIADAIQAQLTKIAGQKAMVTKAKKSIASYKLREGMPVGAMVTLRGERMYDFLQKLICVVLPRIRDFRGISAKSFDGRGNYTLGLKEQSLFPEITYEEVDLVKGMNVSVITTANTDDEARELLRLLGMPFNGAADCGAHGEYRCAKCQHRHQNLFGAVRRLAECNQFGAGAGRRLSCEY